MNDRQSVHDSQYKVVCWNVLGLWRLKHWKIRIADRQRGSNFSRRGKNQYTKRKTESYVFNSFGVGISRGWEWKSSTGRFATGRFWPFTLKTSSVGKDKVNKWDLFSWKLRPVLFFVIVIQHIFPVTHSTIVIRGLSIHLLSFNNEVGLSRQ